MKTKMINMSAVRGRGGGGTDSSRHGRLNLIIWGAVFSLMFTTVYSSQGKQGEGTQRRQNDTQQADHNKRNLAPCELRAGTGDLGD